MATDPLAVVWQQYGLWGFLAYVLVREVWPFVGTKILPEKIAQAKAERLRVAKLEERQMNLEDRQATAIEAMSQSVQQMALAIVTNNERLSTLIAGHASHAIETTNAVALMRERTGSKERRKNRPA